MLSNLYALIVFAQGNTTSNNADPGPWWSSPMIPILAIGVLFMYFMIFLPERQRKKKQQQLFSSMKKNDKVVTIGGIVGVISNISDTDDEVTLRVEEGKLRLLKSSILRVIPKDEEKTSKEELVKNDDRITSNKPK